MGTVLATMATKASFRIGVLAYDGCFGAEIFGLTDLLLIANRVAQARGIARHDLFGVSVIGATGEPVRTAGGFPVGATRWHRRLDALVVPGYELVPTQDLDAKLAGWTRESAFVASAAGRGIPVASICIGAFLLGEAGVLDGRQATTSWLFAHRLAERYPTTTVTPEELVVEDGPVTTTAAFSAVLDLGLAMVRRHAGDEVARATARVTLVADNRTSQAPYVDRAALARAAPTFSDDVKRRLLDRIDQPYDLTALAASVHVSTRTLLRRFSAETGLTPLDFLQAARVDAAKRLLESTDSRVADVMERVGYLDPGSFRRLFEGQVGVTPAAYRRQFQAAER